MEPNRFPSVLLFLVHDDTKCGRRSFYEWKKRSCLHKLGICVKSKMDNFCRLVYGGRRVWDRSFTGFSSTDDRGEATWLIAEVIDNIHLISVTEY